MSTSRTSSKAPRPTSADINPYSYAFQSVWQGMDSRSHSRAASRAASRNHSRATSPAPKRESSKTAQHHPEADINPFSYAYQSMWDRWDSRAASRNASRNTSRAASPAPAPREAESQDPYVLAYRALWKRWDDSHQRHVAQRV